jgi:FkbM family methyltransferase
MRYPCRIHIFDPTPRAIAHFDQLAKATDVGQPFCVNSNPEEIYSITPAVLRRMKFHPWGLAGEDGEQKFYSPANPAHVSCSILNLQKTASYFTAPCLRLKSIAEKMGGARLLKMDIEGAEYAVIHDMIATNMLPEILLVEFDERYNALDENAGQRIADSIKLLEEFGMRHIFMDGANAVFSQAI